MLIVPVAILFMGCVERSMLIETTPAGALVFIDDELITAEDGEAATTPVEIPFVFYGTREIVVRREGHLSLKEKVDLSPPFYEWFPIDFISEILLPWTLKDTHRLSFELTPVAPASVDTRTGLRKRAEAFKVKIPEARPEGD